MRIRSAELEDAATIAEVHLASWKTTYPGIIPQEYIDGLRVEKGIADWRGRLSGESRPTVLVAEDEGGIFGFAAGGAIMHPVDGYDGELGAIYLLASHQGKGAGAALVRRIARELQGQGFRSMAVWVLRDNPACGFYRRMGGVLVGEQRIEFAGTSLPEVAFGWPDLVVLCNDPAQN